MIPRIRFYLTDPLADVWLSKSWNVADRVFKFVQWMFVISIVRYAADKSHSRLLEAVWAILFFCVVIVLQKVIGSFFEFEVAAARRWVAVTIVFVGNVVLSLLVTFMVMYCLGITIDAIVKATH